MDKLLSVDKTTFSMAIALLQTTLTGTLTFFVLKKLQFQREEIHVYVICTLALVASQAMLFLVPVDVSLASGISLAGVRNPAITPILLATVQSRIETAYYVLLALNCFFALIMLPWTYFYAKECNDEEG
jgi:hypothetical protein